VDGLAGGLLDGLLVWACARPKTMVCPRASAQPIKAEGVGFMEVKS
jgi:hypothetical protein